jgi:hypothetical protein
MSRKKALNFFPQIWTVKKWHVVKLKNCIAVPMRSELNMRHKHLPKPGRISILLGICNPLADLNFKCTLGLVLLSGALGIASAARLTAVGFGFGT